MERDTVAQCRAPTLVPRNQSSLQRPSLFRGTASTFVPVTCVTGHYSLPSQRASALTICSSSAADSALELFCRTAAELFCRTAAELFCRTAAELFCRTAAELRVNLAVRARA